MKPFVKRKKNDAADAGAVCEVASRPAMRFVAAERAERQAEGMPFRTRTRRRGTEDADRQRAARAYGERGVAPPQGIAYTARLTAALEDPESRLPDAVRKLGGLLLDRIGIPTGRIKELKAEILKRPPESGEAKRLMDIPGTAPSAPRRSGPVQRNEGLPLRFRRSPGARAEHRRRGQGRSRILRFGRVVCCAYRPAVSGPPLCSFAPAGSEFELPTEPYGDARLGCAVWFGSRQPWASGGPDPARLVGNGIEDDVGISQVVPDIPAFWTP